MTARRSTTRRRPDTKGETPYKGPCPCGQAKGCNNLQGLKRICGAKSRHNRTGICHNDKLLPNGRCRMHGGKSLVGAAHGSFKHGRYSLLLKEHRGLLAHYERARADPDLLALQSEIALVDTRIAELLKRSIDSKALDTNWPQIEILIEQRRKLVDTASKRAKDLHLMMSTDQFMTLVGFVGDSVKRHVTDRAVLALIWQDLQKVLRPGQEFEP